jgi:predicted TIM-barrel fold metal-dependent hydrolase
VIADSPLARAFWKSPAVADCPVYDMHGHMAEMGGIYFPRAEQPDMLHSMDRAGVRLLCFSAHEALFDPVHGNDVTLAAVRKHPDRFRGYMVINGNYMESVKADLARFDDLGGAFVGLKFLSAYHGVALDDARYDPVWEFAAERKLLVLCHTWGGNEMNGPKQVRAVAKRYPEVRLLMGHSCYGEWDEAARLATEFPHVYCELTAVFECRGTLELFVARGLSKRMLFGTDLPWFSPLHGIGCVLSAEISDEDRHNILHRNAEELLEPFLKKPEKP